MPHDHNHHTIHHTLDEDTIISRQNGRFSQHVFGKLFPSSKWRQNGILPGKKKTLRLVDSGFLVDAMRTRAAVALFAAVASSLNILGLPRPGNNPRNYPLRRMQNVKVNPGILKLRGGWQPKRWDRSQGIMEVKMTGSGRKTVFHSPDQSVADPTKRPGGMDKNGKKGSSKPMWQVHAELQAKAKKMRQEDAIHVAKDVAIENDDLMEQTVKELAGDAYERESTESEKDERDRIKDKIKDGEQKAFAISGENAEQVVIGKRDGKNVHTSEYICLFLCIIFIIDSKHILHFMIPDHWTSGCLV
jgi:hypothetical protein